MSSKSIVFAHKSEAHIALLAQKAQERGCNCVAYRDWFTYKLWQDQGMQVKYGEHGVKLVSFPEQEVKAKDGEVKTVKRPRRFSVFCRCQVKPISERSDDNGRKKD